MCDCKKYKEKEEILENLRDARRFIIKVEHSDYDVISSYYAGMLELIDDQILGVIKKIKNI